MGIKVWAGFCVCLAVAFHPRVAFCQSDEDRAGARAAATAGASAMEQGKWQEAIDLFSRAESLVHAPPHLLYIARANVNMGKLVRAREAYLKIIKEELSPTAPKAFRDAQIAASSEAAALEAKIPTVKIVIAGEGASGAVVFMDSGKLSAAMSGVPVPIDPGEHFFKARTLELETPTVPLKVAEGARETLTLELKLSLKGTDAEPVAKPVETPAPPPVAPADRSANKSLRTGAYVAFGAAGVGAILGTVFVLQNRSKRADANDLCTPKCPESARAKIEDLDSSASSAAAGAWIGYGIAVAGAAVGTTLLVLSRPSDNAPQALVVHPTLGGAQLRYSF